MNAKIIINTENCTGCEICIEICPRDCFYIGDKGISTFHSTTCHDCGHCISVCPESAISHRDLPREDYYAIDSDFKDSINNEYLYKFLKSLRSTRKFTEQPIEESIIQKLVDITRYSPTGHHTQDVSITVVTNNDLIGALKFESAQTVKFIIRKLANPFFILLGKIFGRGEAIQKARNSMPRLRRILKGYQEGTDYLFHGAPAVLVFHSTKRGPSPQDNCNQAAAYVRVLARAYQLGTCYIFYLLNFSKYNKKIR